jgi:type II secretory pathway predicted ATPase ExeA
VTAGARRTFSKKPPLERSPAYLRFFGVKDQPFRVTPDPRWAFPAASYVAAGAALREALGERRGMVCLYGEAGTGKTLLLRQLLEVPPEGIRLVPLRYPGLRFEEIVEELALALGLARDAPPGRRLDEVRTAAAASESSPILLVDEAQALSRETLRALPRLFLPPPAGAGVGVLLAGHPDLEAELQAAGLAAHIGVRALLRPLGEDEVGPYVAAELARAESARRDLFTPGSTALIARLTDGIPRLVNIVAEASLVQAFMAGAHTVTSQHVTQAWRDYVEFEAAALEGADFAARARADTLGAATHEARWRRRARPLALGLGGLAAVALAVTQGPRLWERVREARSRMATSEPSAPAASAPAPSERNVLPTAAEAIDLVDAFRRAYETRDAERLRHLLAPDAEEDGRRGRPEVIAAYAAQLEGLEEVVYVQPDARVEPRGDAMEVRAPFVIRFRDRGGQSGELRGRAVWQIARREGRPVIVTLRREIDPDPAPPS